MSKKYSIFVSALFCGFLALFLVWHLVQPDQDFSPNENRYLTQLPTPSFGQNGTFFSGDFMKDFESYVNDQFPLRDGWIGLKALSEKGSGKKANNSVYFGTDGQTLLADFPTPDAAKVEKNFGFVSTLGEKLDIPVYFSLIPGKSLALSDLLPAGAPVGDQSAILAQGATTPNVTWIGLDTLLNAPDNAYYRTDHHWTSHGAQLGYRSLMGGMGLEPLEPQSSTVVSEDFYGTTWSKAGAYWIQPDDMTLLVPDDDVTVTSYLDGTASEGSLYHYDKLEQKDKYPFFLGGNQPLCILDSEKPGAEGSLLVLRDSFSDTLAPLLTQNFAQVHLMDLRYYKASVAQYVAEHNIDRVLVLYSVDNFVTDSNLFVMSL